MYNIFHVFSVEHREKRAVEGSTYIVEVVVWTAPDLFQL